MMVTGYAIAATLLSAMAVGLAVRPPPRLRAKAPTAAPSAARRFARSGPPGIGLPMRAALGVAVGLVAAVMLGTRIGWPTALALAVLAGCGSAEVLARLPSGEAKRRERELILQTPQALDLLAAALSAGLPLRSATAAVVGCSPGPVADEWAAVLQQLELGVGEVEAWRGLSRHPQLGAAAADLARSVESGTMLGSALAVHAEESRAIRTAAVEVAARKVGVRSVLPLMLCFIPAFLLLGIVPTLVSAVLAALAPK